MHSCRRAGEMCIQVVYSSDGHAQVMLCIMSCSLESSQSCSKGKSRPHVLVQMMRHVPTVVVEPNLVDRWEVLDKLGLDARETRLRPLR